MDFLDIGRYRYRKKDFSGALVAFTEVSCTTGISHHDESLNINRFLVPATINRSTQLQKFPQSYYVVIEH
jgi:hypothetical protein